MKLQAQLFLLGVLLSALSPTKSETSTAASTQVPTATQHLRNRESCFLFIGIQSYGAPQGALQRQAVRNTWLPKSGYAVLPGEHEPERVVHKFIMKSTGNVEHDAALDAENDQYGDMLFHTGRMEGTPKYVFFNTLTLIRYADLMVQTKFILKTDDDAYLDLPRIVLDLKSLCTSPGCARERLYWGELRVGSVVHREGRWGNMRYINSTGSETYMPHMHGAAYVLSADLASTLALVDKHVGFTEMPGEDTTMGWWLSAWDVRRIDRSSMIATKGNQFCCVRPAQPKGTKIPNRKQMRIVTYSERIMVYHKVKARDMATLHNFTHNANDNVAYCFGDFCYDAIDTKVLDPNWEA